MSQVFAMLGRPMVDPLRKPLTDPLSGLFWSVTITVTRARVEASQTGQRVPAPELFIGLVGAVGTELSAVSDLITEILDELSYDATVIQLIELVREVPGWEDSFGESAVFQRAMSKMTAGNDFREATERSDALALLAVQYVRSKRAEFTGSTDAPALRKAYIFRSLKNPSEVDTFREIYGDGFILVAAYSSRENRREYLARRIAGSTYSQRGSEHDALADRLILRDEKESQAFGQNVRDTFPLADLFVDVSRPRSEVKSAIERFVSLVFDYQFHTPTKDEFAMFHAYAAALRSAELGRQVGASLAGSDGEIMGLGTNEVPKAGGGLYWAGDHPDRRDYNLGRDTSDEMKVANVAEVLEALKASGWLSDLPISMSTDTRVQTAASILKGTRMMSPIEYGRAVHAEMAAFMDAARRGVSVIGATLYTTTFPCHNCTRHIIAAGVTRVVFIEPYAKSLAQHLHLDAIDVETPRAGPRVVFEPYVGVAPRQYVSLFRMRKRKNLDGTIVAWTKPTAFPRLLPPSTSYFENEELHGDKLKRVLEKNPTPKPSIRQEEQ